MKTLFVLLSFIFSGLSVVPSPAAETTHPQGGPCRADVEKLCKGVQPGHGGIMACLAKNEDALSPACKEVRGKAKQKMREARGACWNDIQTLCRDVKPGQGGILRCLQEKDAQVSPECKKERDAMKERAAAGRSR